MKTTKKVRHERRDTYVGTFKLHVGTRYRFEMWDVDQQEHWEHEGTMAGVTECGVSAVWIDLEDTTMPKRIWRGDILKVEEV